ncbi:MAG: hypothetical protein ACRDYB_16330, partial [Acidimicrobiales bacterium]
MLTRGIPGVGVPDCPGAGVPDCPGVVVTDCPGVARDCPVVGVPDWPVVVVPDWPRAVPERSGGVVGPAIFAVPSGGTTLPAETGTEPPGVAPFAVLVPALGPLRNDTAAGGWLAPVAAGTWTGLAMSVAPSVAVATLANVAVETAVPPVPR